MDENRKAKLFVNRHYTISRIDPRLYGSFVEHLGRCVYYGIYDPKHPQADEQGFRRDVLQMVRELGVPVVRYPGGNFVSSYNWEDGVGPKDKRPVRAELAWRTLEPNEVGTNEFCDWAKKAGTEVMMAVNLGTRGIAEAASLVEYCNLEGGTYYSDLRRSHGYASPHDIKLWCMGCELDGPWQIGQKTAKEYGTLAAQTGKAMKRMDDSIELVACGSSNRQQPTFGAWEAEVLDLSYEVVDYIAIHQYYENLANDTPNFLARTLEMQDYITSVAAICDYIKAKHNSKKTVHISFEEWNILYHSVDEDFLKTSRHSIAPWQFAPPQTEDVYNLEDALLIGALLITLLKNSDRVKIGCLAQLVNVIAPIMTENGGRAWRQTIFYPFMHASRYGRGTALHCALESPRYDSRDFCDVDYVESTAVLADDGSITVFAVNRNLESSMELDIVLEDFGSYAFESFTVLDGDDLKAVNTADDPDRIVPHSGGRCVHEDGMFKAALSPRSWNVLRFCPQPNG